MKPIAHSRSFAGIGALVVAGSMLGASALAAGPEIASGPSADPKCFAPWTPQTKFFKFAAHKGPDRA